MELGEKGRERAWRGESRAKEGGGTAYAYLFEQADHGHWHFD